MRVVPDDVWAVLTIFCEARGEPYPGKLAVARVIRNRVSGNWARDAAGVVLQPYQFSCWNTQDPNRIVASRMASDEPTVRDCFKAWEESLTQDGGVGDATMYYAPAGVAHPPAWATEEKFVAQVGSQRFYRS